MGSRGEREWERAGRAALLRVVTLTGHAAHDAQTLLRTAVDNAREAGATWAEIGAALDINGECAAKRFRGWADG